MLTILVTIIVVGLVLIGVLWLGTLWAQAYFYDSPVDNLNWRAPAAAGALLLFFFIWLLIEHQRPETTDTIFRFSSEHADEFDRFISVRRNEEGEQEIVFERRSLPGGRADFRDGNGNTWLRSRSGMMVALILEEKVNEGGEEKVVRRRFNAEMSADGKTFVPRASGGSVRYVEENGRRFITEDQPGKVFRYRRGLMVFNVFLNVVHFALWFAVLWMLLRFQWPHALLGAFICWLVLTLAVLPYMLDRARGAASKRAAPKAAAMFPAGGRAYLARVHHDRDTQTPVAAAAV